MPQSEHYSACNDYLDSRQGTYEFRCRRYGVIADKLELMGLSEGDIIVDMGAGRCEFGRYLRERFPKLGLYYIPFDGAIDGINLEDGVAPIFADFYVAIEVIEHLSVPEKLLSDMATHARKGIAVTTPNADCVDVLKMDITHKTPINTARLLRFGCVTQPLMMFTEDRLDTIVAWKAHSDDPPEWMTRNI